MFSIHNLLYLVLLTLLPGLELRLSIPTGILFLGMQWQEVFIIAVATNIVLGPVIYFALDHLLELFRRVPIIDDIYKRLVSRVRKKAAPYVDRWGFFGIALFVAIPLPGSGSWSGALIAYLLGLGYKRFFIANLVGVLIAGTIVTISTLIIAGIL